MRATFISVLLTCFMGYFALTLPWVPVGLDANSAYEQACRNDQVMQADKDYLVQLDEISRCKEYRQWRDKQPEFDDMFH